MLPKPTVAEPPSLVGVFVMTLITPLIASEPYRADAAPLSTSTRSMDPVGIELRPPLPLRFIGTPFTRTKEPRSRPRIFTRLSIAPYSRPDAP